MANKTNLKVYANGDAAFLIWRNVIINGCLGYAIKKKINDKEVFLTNKFDTTQKKYNNTASIPSDKSPFRRFNWEDMDVKPGNEVSYQVVAVDINGFIDSSASNWVKVTISNNVGNNVQLYFNRGIVINQFIQDNVPLVKNLIKLAGTPQLEDPQNKTILHLRDTLAGQLRPELLSLLKNAKKVYACLFELNDEDVINAFIELGANCNLILADGSSSDSTVDENKAVRDQLDKTDVKVSDRLVRENPGTKGHLGHNKFIIFCDENDSPQSIWTGSTNITVTGFCTQVNNAILINNPAVAEIYYEYWKELYNAGNTQPQELKENNSTVKTEDIGSVGYSVWFSPAIKYADLNGARKYIEEAKEGILFLMFEPGTNDVGLFNEIQKLDVSNPKLYIKGVKNTLHASTLPAPESNTNSKSKTSNGMKYNHQVQMLGYDSQKYHNFDIIQPTGIPEDFMGWVKEIARGQFLAKNGIGHAIIHSKLIVIDPLSDNPVVITGSNNFSESASTKNDENMIIIEGNKQLAAAFSVNIMNVYNYYRWRFLLVQDGGTLMPYKDDDWQQHKLRGSYAKELDFWGL